MGPAPGAARPADGPGGALGLLSLRAARVPLRKAVGLVPDDVDDSLHLARLKFINDLFGLPVLGEKVDSRRDRFRHALFGGPFGPGAIERDSVGICHGPNIPWQGAARIRSGSPGPATDVLAQSQDRRAAFTVAHRQTILASVAQHAVPAIHAYRQAVVEGGLMSYAPDTLDIFRRSAGYIDRILKGAKPGDLPAQAPIKFEFVLNLKTAKALDLDVPPTLLALADEVIE